MSINVDRHLLESFSKCCQNMLKEYPDKCCEKGEMLKIIMNISNLEYVTASREKLKNNVSC